MCLDFFDQGWKWWYWKRWFVVQIPTYHCRLDRFSLPSQLKLTLQPMTGCVIGVMSAYLIRNEFKRNLQQQRKIENNLLHCKELVGTTVESVYGGGVLS